MPSVLLPAPRFEQSRDGACLPACTRMALAYWGDLRDEVEVSALLGTQSFGTPISRVTRLKEWGYNATIRNSSRADLESLLNDGIPVIARVWTVMLDYWPVETSHVVLVVGYDEHNAFINDPAYAGEGHSVTWDAFLAAWAEFDEMAIVIRPSG
jgi:ABC-type bacteriocin/lantibiotic exporter with double-glycine peptidase domain